MLGDAVAAKKASGEAKDTLEVVDVAQVLARSIQPPTHTDVSAVLAGPAEHGQPDSDGAQGTGIHPGAGGKA
jgi:hypothetical protein